MNNYLPSIIYKNLNNIIEKKEINIFINFADEALHKNHIQAIINAFFNNMVIASNGLPYIKIEGLGTILRTGNSGAHRSLVYQGVPNVIGAPPVIEVNGYDYISGYELIKLIEYRKDFSNNIKTKRYLEFAQEIFNKVLDLKQVRQSKELFLNEIREKRPLLKKARIEEYFIYYCELTDKKFYDSSEVEFSHIESVVLNPFKALDIDNGLIVLKEIHKKITLLKINTAEELYAFCIKNGYKTNWIDDIK